MDNLFSHAASDAAETPEPEAADGLDPVVYTVVVPGACRVPSWVSLNTRTSGGRWRPQRLRAGSYVEFEENLILETADDGRTAIWGSIDDWQPPLSFHASWHPGTSAVWSTELRVAFRAVEGGTELRLVHSGWEGAEDPAATRASTPRAGPGSGPLRAVHGRCRRLKVPAAGHAPRPAQLPSKPVAAPVLPD